MHPEVTIIIIFIVTNTFECMLYARYCAKCLRDSFINLTTIKWGRHYDLNFADGEIEA